MTRRTMLQAAGPALWTLDRAMAAPQSMPLKNLGIAPAGLPVRSRAGRAGTIKFDYVEHCHNLGVGVVELREFKPEEAQSIRRKMEAYHMRAIGNVPLPRDETGLAAFDVAIKAAKEAGIIGNHAAMTGRRYEEFDTFEQFKTNFERCQKIVAMAEPILRKHRMPLFLENHKGWRSAEQAAWIKRMGSEWIGVHLDFGNNVSLCEDPMETLTTLLPYTHACHIKDMAVEPYDDGFLLSEVPLGDGFLDIKGMVALLQKKDPNIPLDLEMITRDPLKIPIFTKNYWATFDDTYSPMPGRDVARVVEIVVKNGPKSPPPKTSGLSPEAQLKLEDDCIDKSIAWARQNLNVS
jgi:sugar phosphate isomerase/epimerase